MSDEQDKQGEVPGAETPEEAKPQAKTAAKKAPAKKAAAKAGGEGKAAEGKAAAKADGDSKAAAEKPAAKKTAAKKPAKAPARAKADAPDAGDEPHEGQNAPEKQRRRKKAVAVTPAAPGSTEEAKEAAKAKPAAATRTASGAKGTQRRRVVRAHARYVRTSARKARMVCGHLRGKSVQEARAILAFTPREVARDWSKLLESAVANAESNHELLEDDLIVREAYADEGPTIKRFRPRAMGRATPIRKRTSHLTIALIPRPQDANTKRKG
jgi:ribosomal protein L22